MNNKTIWVIGAVVVLAVFGYVLFGMEKEPVESPAPQGKLDINVVCEGALAYMTFPDGESAAKFVAECKEGKHPEVIEKYKADMNLGDGATI
jgi:hypothetical protein